jgi:putative membrane-bound dehydrogenase-like protein
MSVPQQLPRLAVLLLCLSAVGVVAFQDTKPWPPPLQSVSDESPVLSPEEAMKTFFMPPGYRLELVASEPMIEEPVAIDWDSDGRLWVVEMPSYMRDLAATGERDPVGRVSVLEDTNGDGKMDKKTVFLDGLVLPRAVKVLEHGVLVGEPPNLWLARDTTGDLRADTKERVTDTYGQEFGNVEHNANALIWGMDNWIHTSNVDTFLRFRDGKFEVRQTLSRGQWGATQDDAGRVYRNTNSAALFVDIVPTPYFARHPDLLRTRGSYESLGGSDLNATWPVRPTTGVNRGYQDGVLRPDGTLSSYTSVCAPTVYRGDRLPQELYGDIFLAEPAGNLVSRIVVSDDGTMLRGRNAYEKADFLTSTDERFRPVFLSSAPDGTLYIVDMYHGIIQHRDFITEYLRDEILARNLDRPSGYGRIYRVVHETTKRDRSPALSKASSAELVEVLAHPNGWWRDTAQRILVERGDRSVAKLLTERARTAPDWRTRVHAMWTLDGLDSLEPSVVVQALEHPERDVRMNAVRLTERWLGEPKHPMQAELLARIDDQDWAVRRQLAATLGEFPEGSPAKIAAVTTLLERHGDDPITVDATLSGIRGSERAVLARLLDSPDPTPQRTAAATTLTATMVRSGEAAIQELLALGSEANRPEWQIDVLLSGAEAALLGAPLPGTPRRVTPAPTVDPTAPGGRAGPGGAYAFRKPEPAPAGRGRGSAQAAIRLSEEPSPLIELAAGGGPYGARADALLARFTWPGKTPSPGDVPAAAPLTAEEQQRFEAGRTVYTNLCMACHQQDGRGMEKLAPTLIGSPYALGSPVVGVRVLVNGKEGPVGLMPPLGAVLSDDQIAAVLTYIRRSWGHEATAVDPATVGDERRAVAGRTRPWTEAELESLLER